MLIAIDARYFYDAEMSGYQTFTREIFLTLATQQSSHQFLFIVDKTFAIENNLQGHVSIQMLSMVGQLINQTAVEKTSTKISKTIDTSEMRPGIYLILVQQQGQTVVKKWAKL